MPENDRKNAAIVVAALKQYLSSTKGSLLLCLDNADNAADRDVSKILTLLCSVADARKKNDWIVLTSRQGRSTL